MRLSKAAAAFVSLVATWLVFSGILAQEGTQPTVTVAQSDSYGAYLTDAAGNSLYLFQDDANVENDSACYDRCAQNWIPLTVEGEPVAGEGVDASLLGTITRQDGSTQVTYNGWPLYTYVRDQEPGQAFGHGTADRIFLVTPQGEVAQEAGGGEGAEVDEERVAQLMEQGGPLFAANCAACHGDQGQGLVGPSLNGLALVGRTNSFVNTILMGRSEHGMPAFRNRLNDEQIAAIATYVRNSWSNEFGPVTPEEVAQLR